MMVLPKRRLKKAFSFNGSGTAAAADDAIEAPSPQQQQLTNGVSNALNLLHLNLQKGCSSVVYPSSDAERSSSSGRNDCSSINIPSLSSLSSSNGSPSWGSPIVGSPSKPHKSNDTAWESVQSMKSADGNLDISNFKLLQRVGGGDIGNVFLAELNGLATTTTTTSNIRFAVKIMEKEHLIKRNKLTRITTERQILEMLDHPFLPTLYGSFETPEYACFVMEFCPGGDLHKLRQRQPAKCFDEEAVRFYAAEVLLAMEYLHMMGVVYRDLKPENVLIREDGHIMLTDFDLSLQFNANPSLLKPHRLQSLKSSCMSPSLAPFLSCANPSASRSATTCVPSSPKFLRKHASLPKRIWTTTKQQLDGTSSNSPKRSLTRSSSSLPQLNVEPLHVRSMSFVGTHEYLAPEIIAGGGHGSAVDWWTLGVFIYELLYGETPFKGTDNDATLINAFSKHLNFPTHVQVSQCAKELIKSLLVKVPRRRLGYSRGAAEIKTHPFFEDINWPLIRWTQPPEVPKPFQLDQSQSLDNNTTSDFSANATSDFAAKDQPFECF